MVKLKKKGKGLLNINSFHQDALMETSNICTATASQALSVLINKRIYLDTPELFIEKYEYLNRAMPKSNSLMIASYSPIKGDLKGNLAIFFQKSVALKIYQKVRNRSKVQSIITRKNMEDLQEIGNILFGNYLTGFNLLLGTNVIHSPPHIITTFGDSLIDFLTLNIQDSKYCLILKSNIHIGFKKRAKKDGFFILVLNIDAVKELIRLINKKVKK